jgi:hypothetical protein
MPTGTSSLELAPLTPRTLGRLAARGVGASVLAAVLVGLLAAALGVELEAAVRSAGVLAGVGALSLGTGLVVLGVFRPSDAFAAAMRVMMSSMARFVVVVGATVGLMFAVNPPAVPTMLGAGLVWCAVTATDLWTLLSTTNEPRSPLHAD